MHRPLKSILVPALCAGTFLGLASGIARAADVAATPPPPPANWWDTITVSGSATPASRLIQTVPPTD